jgi:glycosyltransferase involved in cell wall biosynthesis
MVLPETGFRKYLKMAVNRISYIRADYVYAISGFVRQRLINKNCYPEERIIRILNGIDVEKFSCGDSNDNKDEIVIFCCARAKVEKGIPTLIKATELLIRKFDIKNFTVQYGGSGPDLTHFEQMAKNLKVTDNMLFLGELSNVHEHMCKADIVVVPSEWGEGFGSAVAEAMAAGRALVATRVGGIPEVVGGEEFGVLIPAGDSEILAETLANLIHDDNARRKLGQNARERARKKFSETTYHHNVTQRLLRDLKLV